jgi:hypothetical protein
MIRTSLKGGNIRIAPSPVAICFWRTSRISLVIDSKAAVHRAALTNWSTRISRIIKQQIYPVLSFFSHKHLLPGTSSWRFQIKDIAHAKEQAAIEDYSAPHRSGFGRTYRKSTELAASLVDLGMSEIAIQDSSTLYLYVLFRMNEYNKQLYIFYKLFQLLLILLNKILFFLCN